MFTAGTLSRELSSVILVVPTQPCITAPTVTATTIWVNIMQLQGICFKGVLQQKSRRMKMKQTLSEVPFRVKSSIWL